MVLLIFDCVLHGFYRVVDIWLCVALVLSCCCHVVVCCMNFIVLLICGCVLHGFIDLLIFGCCIGFINLLFCCVLHGINRFVNIWFVLYLVLSLR